MLEARRASHVMFARNAVRPRTLHLALSVAASPASRQERTADLTWKDFSNTITVTPKPRSDVNVVAFGAIVFSIMARSHIQKLRVDQTTETKACFYAIHARAILVMNVARTWNLRNSDDTRRRRTTVQPTVVT